MVPSRGAYLLGTVFALSLVTIVSAENDRVRYAWEMIGKSSAVEHSATKRTHAE